MRTRRTILGLVFLLLLSAIETSGQQPVARLAVTAATVEFCVQLDTISAGFDKKSCWVLPRVGIIGGTSSVVLTMNRAGLAGSDLFSPLHEMRTDDLGKTWSAPVEHAATLGRRQEPNGVEVGICDFWPKWHAKSGRLLGVGHTVRYQKNAAGHERLVPARARETAYSIYDPTYHTWTPWKTLPMPDKDTRFHNAGAGSVQRVDLPDGDVLLPIYFGGQQFLTKGVSPFRVVVLRCAFDGGELRVREMGNELHLDVQRGLVEPSLTRFQGRYYLTLRNDLAGYVCTSDDGLHFGAPKRWTWDDGSDLGSYNTQQHWVTHDRAMFLVYTRRGANNDHIPRHRAPLFMAQVDPERLCVLRLTERELMPQRGAKLGNFGVTEVSENETWVTDAEWMQTNPPNFADYTQCMKYGSDNAVFVARIQWETPNKNWNQH